MSLLMVLAFFVVVSREGISCAKLLFDILFANPSCPRLTRLSASLKNGITYGIFHIH